MDFTPRAAITLVFIAFGVMAGLQIGAIPTLKSQSGIDSFLFGVLSGIYTGIGIFGMSLGGLINRRLNHRTVLLLVLPILFAAFAWSLTSHSVAIFGMSFIVFNFFFGVCDVFMNAEATMVEHASPKPVFASFHAAVLYAIGFSGLAGSFIATNYGPLWAMVPALPLAALAFYSVHAAISDHSVAEAEDTARTKLPRKILTLIGVVIGLDVSAEIGAIVWSGQMLQDMRPELAAYSGVGVAFYGLCNGTIRLIGDRLRARFGDISIVLVSLCIGFAGFLVLATGPSFSVSVAAFAVVGAGLSLTFPCLYSLAARAAPDARAAALGLASSVSGPPRILLPFVFGYLAKAYGLNSIYIASAAGVALAFGFTLWVAREINKKGAQDALRPESFA